MNYRKTILKAACCIIALGTTPALAEWKGVAHVGYEFGGDKILDVQYSDGSSSTINAGDGIVFAGGASYVVSPEVTVQTTLGWKYQTIQQATNGGADFTRFPLDVIAQYSQSNLRLGAGITYHLSPSLSTSGAASTYSPSRSFDDAMGTVFQFDYTTESGFIWGLRYTDLTYKDKYSEVDGGSFGVHMTGSF